MDEDASLDDFSGGESSEQSEADADSGDETASTTAGESATAATDDAGPAADIEPAKTTYAWTGEGAECGACGETVERRWQQDDGLVCIECKDWDRP